MHHLHMTAGLPFIQNFSENGSRTRFPLKGMCFSREACYQAIITPARPLLDDRRESGCLQSIFNGSRSFTDMGLVVQREGRNEGHPRR